MRAKVSWIHHLTRASTRLSNRLRAVLLRYYPAVLQVFPDLSTQIALGFIRTYPTPQAAARLTLAEFEEFAQPTLIEKLFDVGESFFATLECELLDRETFHSPVEARQAVFAFIEGWYNLHRLHSALGYTSPSPFEWSHAHLAGLPSPHHSTKAG